MTKLLDRHGAPLRASAYSGFGGGFGGGGGFEGARSDRQQTRAWPSFSIPSSNETMGARQPTSARARDLVRNNGNAKGAQTKQIARVIGKGRRFRCRPDHEALGISTDQARELGRAIERELALWGGGMRPQCDIGREMSYGQMQRVMYADRYTAGENTAAIRWRPNRGTRYATCLQLIDPERLGNANDMPDTPQKRQGIHFSDDGEPTAYDIRRFHQGDVAMGAWAFEWDELPRFDGDGRPVLVHGFTADRAEQVRGLSAFASILIAFRDVQRFTEAELGAAIINALFAAFVKSNFDPIAVAESLGLEGGGDLAGQVQSWQSVRGEIAADGYRIGDNLLPVLAPGDDVSVPTGGRNTGGFDQFAGAVHRGIANGLGMDAPTFTGDLSGVNYSSLQYGLAGIWDLVTGEGFEFDSDTLAPIEYAVIQEAFERGYITEPSGADHSFDDLPQAYLNGRHIGPGRPQIDRVKNAQASALEIYLGLDSATNIAAENGRDYEEILADQAEERALAEQYGFVRATLSEVGGVKSEDPDQAQHPETRP